MKNPILDALGVAAKEKIFRAAVRYKGKVYEAVNHGEAVNKLFDAFEKYPSAKEADKIYKEIEQGFTTTTGRYVDREEAYRLAETAEQIKRQHSQAAYRPDDDRWKGKLGMEQIDIIPRTEE